MRYIHGILAAATAVLCALPVAADEKRTGNRDRDALIVLASIGVVNEQGKCALDPIFAR